jgi:long-chain acyl-CoA synthetase
MPRDTLAGFFDDLAAKTGEFLVYDDGFRIRRYQYRDVGAAARGFAGRLHEAGLRKGDAVLFWAENRPEWIAAFWGCILTGVVVVPADFRSSLEFARRIAGIVHARVALVGDDVTAVADISQLSFGGDVEVWRLSHLDWRDRRSAPPVPLGRDDIAEIIFTSGATAEPKGVVISHRNLLANIVPIEGEVLKYRRYGRPFFPLRFLNLLPLSHMFGQAMATFIPPMLPGTVIFMRGFNPADIVSQVKTRRVSVLVSVPKILGVVAEHVRRTIHGVEDAPPGHEHVARRWWRYRAVHRAFGLKFWAAVVGAAPLEPSLEEFWSRLGFLVIQGYGLTETAPIVSLNHPFAARKGSVGKALPGVQVKIAPDGEILVRGDNVTRGYYGAGQETAEASEDGWLHTGDIGELDAAGRLFVRGRKKEMIVTPEGLNVFPEDVERVLLEQAGVLDCAVVGLARGGEERVHAVVVVQPGTDTDTLVRAANARLADHQRVRGISVWPAAELPRTDGTGKLKRREVQRWVETGVAPPRGLSDSGPLDALLARFAGDRELRPETTIEELGLGSLERVELMVALEERSRTTIDESRLSEARNVGELRALMAAGPEMAGDGRAPATERAMPTWNRSRLVAAFRTANLAAWVLPVTRLFARIRVEGLEHLDIVDGPVVFASNHQSHMDTPVILAALPGRRRRHLAVAMAKEFFVAHFHPAGHPRRQRITAGILYYLAAFFFNAFPLPQREAGARRTLRYIGDLVSDGWSVLIFPEGRRTDAGEISEFRPGVGMVGSRLGVPVVPVRLEGVERVLHKSWKMARRGQVRVTFGPPVALDGEDYARLAGQIESAVRAL